MRQPINLDQERATYIEALDLNNASAAMVIPANTMHVMLDILEFVEPGVVFESGCGWSSIVIGRWCDGAAEHVINENNVTWQLRLLGSLTLAGCFPRWIQPDGIGEAVAGKTWAALIDGDIAGRERAVLELLPHAARGVMLLDDANADYVQRAAEPLKRLDTGKLYDLRSATSVMRNQETWCWLWVGNDLAEKLDAVTEGQPVCE